MTDRPHHIIALCVTLAALATSSCGQIDPGPPVDEEGEVIPLPPPYQEWLRVVSVEPVAQGEDPTLAARPTFAVRFNQYLDDETFKSYSNARLSSGGLRAGGETTYVMTRKTILWTPFRDLRQGYRYTFELTMDGLRSVTNAPRLPGDDPSPVFVIDREAGATHETGLDPEPVAWPAVRAMFEHKGCYGCHGEPGWGYLNGLEYEDLVGVRAADAESMLVRPLDASDSYLMHKLLPDYPVRSGGVHPRAWDTRPGADTRPLTEAQLWSVERWIEAGAPRE